MQRQLGRGWRRTSRTGVTGYGLVSRSGGQSAHPGMEHVALDATDRKSLAASAAGFDVMYNCANPGPYPLWEERWPPLAASILAAAEDSGTVLVTLSNLYGYGRVDGPITRNQPLRAGEHKGALRNRMWEGALAAHNAGPTCSNSLRSGTASCHRKLLLPLTPAQVIVRDSSGGTLRGRSS